MSAAASIALLGLSPFERATFEAFLRLASRRAPAYTLQADPACADFVIVDADDPAAVAQAVAGGLLPRSVLLGAVAPPGAAAHLPRPIQLMQTVRALDALPRAPRDESPPQVVATVFRVPASRQAHAEHSEDLLLRNIARPARAGDGRARSAARSADLG